MQTSDGSFVARQFVEPNQEGKQMTVEINSKTGAPSALFESWKSINWNHVEEEVKRLQMRIAKATKEGKFGKVKSLQWILSHSYHAKLLAVKRVTENRGCKTSGVDGIVWKSDKQKLMAVKSLKRRGYSPLPLRRIYIPKKNGKLRPLGIPSMRCRAFQALHLLGLEPVSETLADNNSYGFRAKRSCADAIGQCFINFSRKCSAKWILEGDIRACFDKISHEWLLKNIPMDRSMLKKWLACGFVEQGELFPTNEGTPQGGIISPTLLSLTMKGLEAKVGANTKRSDQVNIVVYADDFIVSGKSKEILENKVKPVIVSFLRERGLELSEEKTLVTHIDKGFDFLGHSVRKYNDKLIIKPSKKSIKTFLGNIRSLIKKRKTVKTEALIRQLNPKIMGWGNYFKHVCAKEVFSFIDHHIFLSTWEWSKRRHSNRSKVWIYKKYFADPSIKKKRECSVLE